VSPSTGHPSTEINKILSFFLWLAGSHVIFNNEVAAIVSGMLTMLLMVAFFPVGKRLQIQTEVLPLVCISCFLIVSMAITALFRCNVPGVAANASRYLIYPHFLVALIFIFLVYRLQNKKIALPVIATLTLAILIPYKDNYRWGKDCLPALRHNLQYTDYYNPDKGYAKKAADEACRLKIYCIQNFR
jgi:hypothetical protein